MSKLLNIKFPEEQFTETTAAAFIQDTIEEMGEISIANHLRTTLKARARRERLDQMARELLRSEKTTK